MTEEEAKQTAEPFDIKEADLSYDTSEGSVGRTRMYRAFNAWNEARRAAEAKAKVLNEANPRRSPAIPTTEPFVDFIRKEFGLPKRERTRIGTYKSGVSNLKIRQLIAQWWDDPLGGKRD